VLFQIYLFKKVIFQPLAGVNGNTFMHSFTHQHIYNMARSVAL